MSVGKRAKSFSCGVPPMLTVLAFALAGAFFAQFLRANAAGARAAGKPVAVRAAEPWTGAEIVQPAQLAKELAVKGKSRPVVVCVGFSNLFEGAHIPGAVFHGPASQPAGMADLKKWAEGVSRSTNLIVYCGCCPFAKCPNVRPAFETLRAMGFQHLRVLALPNTFYKDWYSKGYPVEKGK